LDINAHALDLFNCSEASDSSAIDDAAHSTLSAACIPWKWLPANDVIAARRFAKPAWGKEPALPPAPIPLSRRICPASLLSAVNYQRN
jgi:hypothetical protein